MSILTSLPGVIASSKFESPYTWTPRTSSTTDGIRGIAYDGSTYWTCVCAYGASSSDIITASSTAQTWTSRFTNKNPMRDLECDGITFCAIGDSGYMITATDPTSTWTSRTSGFGSNNIQGIFYDGSTYWLAMGESGTLTTATDPTSTWSVNSSAATAFGSSGIRSCAYDGSTYVMVGEDGKLATATDPTSTWSLQTSSFGSTDIRYIAYSPDLNLFCAVANDGKIATASGTDITTWTQRNNPFGSSEIITTIQWDYIEDLFVAVGNATTLALSNDGIRWHKDVAVPVNMWDLRYGNGFLVMGGNGGLLYTSYN